MPNLVKKFQNISNAHSLWKRNSKIVLGVSGGPDSMCMLDIFLKLKLKYNLELIIAHVNYGLRGKDSNADEKLVKELSKKSNLEFSLLRAKKAEKSNLEENLRNIRYDFFEKVRKENNFDSIAVAHNLDDQAETFLMRVIRGSGLQGLSSMRHKNEKIIRPLLGISRKEILEYLKKNKIKYRIDKTNLKNLFLRNKIRNGLIPYLEKNFNPKIKNTLFEASLSIADDYDFISKSAARKNDAKNLSVKELLSFSPSMIQMTLRNTILEKKTNLRNINSSHIREIVKILRSPKGKNQEITLKGLKIKRKGDKVTIEKI